MTETTNTPAPSMEVVKSFCAASRDAKYDMTEPAVIGGWLYATNGYVCIRVLSDEARKPAKNFPPANKLFARFPDRGQFTEVWPAADLEGPWTGVGNHHIDNEYAAMIGGLPNVRWAPGRKFDAPLPFIFDGGEGVVIGLRKFDGDE